MHDLETIAPPLPKGEFSLIIDVRTPLEFTEDHLPNAINLPVLSNEQRAQVGTLYKNKPFDGRALGAQLISENIAAHLEQLRQEWPRDQTPLLYCWRGGLRSRSFAFILRSIGWRARILEGGYKAYRRFIINDLQTRLSQTPLDFHVLAGLTGTGKTRLLQTLAQQGAQILDLEGLANHRGSLLGTLGPQPSQKHFENLLHQAISSFDPAQPIFTEAESNRIGELNIPAPLWRKLNSATVSLVELPLPSRAQLLLGDYPQFLDNPEQLSNLLNELRRLRGNNQVDQWQSQIKQRNWPAFLTSILQNHYDLAYRIPGSEDCNYQPPSQTLSLPDHTPKSFTSIAQHLLSKPVGKHNSSIIHD
ncbi:MAG: tRNA 2-selenouridine(34) synthase MnmH [Verrucomicrobiota bacterium]